MVIDSNIIKIQNPWWEDPAAIERDQHLLEIRDKTYRYTPSVLRDLSMNAGDIHIMRGPRQVGKTTTLKIIIQKLIEDGVPPSSITYLSCESLESFHELEQLLIDCLNKVTEKHVYLFLDEISFVTEWQRAILAIANMGLTRNATLILTGSNARDLKESAERLPGRRGKGKDHKLYPLSITELGNLECFKNKHPEEIMEIFMLVGGFPRAIADYVNVGSVTDATYETYRNWIVGDAQRYELRQETLKQIMFRIAATIASRVTWPTLIENSPVRSHETALQYVEHLHDAFLCTIHYCYDGKTKGPAYQKARKLFFIDPLLYAISATWREAIPNIFSWMKTQLSDADTRGKLFEGVVVNHAARLHERVFYWYSTKQHKEVDLIIQAHDELMFYDVKSKPREAFKAAGHTVNILDPAAFLRFISTREQS